VFLFAFLLCSVSFPGRAPHACRRSSSDAPLPAVAPGPPMPEPPAAACRHARCCCCCHHYGMQPLEAWEWEWDNQVIVRAFVPTASYPEQLHNQRAHGGLKNGCRTNKNS
jgi:hypothetical protein